MHIRICFLSALLPTVFLASGEEPSDSLVRELQEIVVTADQPATRLEGNVLVSTITGSNLQNLGTALDVLAQLPLMKVEDGAVSVAGKGIPDVYIDGRPMRDGDELRNLSSSDLKKVELLLAPGAMYGNTTEAVVRITTRKRFWKGFSFTNRAAAEKRRCWSASDMIDAGWRSGNLELFATGSVSRYDSRIKGTTVNRLEYDGEEAEIGSSQDNRAPSTVGVVKAGFNFSSGAHSAGAYYRYNPEHGDFCNEGSEWTGTTAPVRRRIDRDIRSRSHLAAVYYDGNLAGKCLLHFDGTFRRSSSTSATATTYAEEGYAEVSSVEKKNSSLYAGKLYASLPLFKGDFTTGIQDSYTHTRLDYRMLNQAVGEYIPSGLTETRQKSLAAFAQWNRTFHRFSVSAGLRYEYVDYAFDKDGRRDNDVSRRNHLLTPDISLGYSFCDDASVSISYKMSTEKPPYPQLTGSLNYVGIHEIEGGNPALRDGRMHNLQVFGMWRGFILQASFMRSIDTYAFVKELYPAPTLQLMMHPVNIDVSALNLFLVWSRPIGKWTPNFTIGVYRQWLEAGGGRHDCPIFSYYLDNVVALPFGMLLSVNAHGQTRGDMHTNRFGTTWFALDASISRAFFNKSLDVKLSATDIFGTLNNDWTMDTYGVSMVKRQSYDRRGVTLTLTYRFRPRASRYKGEAASQSELDRL